MNVAFNETPPSFTKDYRPARHMKNFHNFDDFLKGKTFKNGNDRRFQERTVYRI